MGVKGELDVVGFQKLQEFGHIIICIELSKPYHLLELVLLVASLTPKLSYFFEFQGGQEVLGFEDEAVSPFLEIQTLTVIVCLWNSIYSLNFRLFFLRPDNRFWIT